MGHGNHIIPAGGKPTPLVSTDGNKPGKEQIPAKIESPNLKNPKENASLLLNREWQKSKADKLKNNLETIISGRERKLETEPKKNSASTVTGDKKDLSAEPKKSLAANSGEKRNPASETENQSKPTVFNDRKSSASESKDNLKTDVPDNKKDLITESKDKLKTIVFNDKKNSVSEQKNNVKTYLSGEKKDLINELKDSLKTVAANDKRQSLVESSSQNYRQNSIQRQTEQAKNLLNKTWDNLIGVVKEHKDLEHLQRQPKEFWDKVRQMSEVRIVETYTNGKTEPRAVSRYGELLNQLNRSGRQLENFVNSLPAGERKIFLARLQINRVLGANELFVGRGIALDKRGQFPVRVFLSANGKNAELPAHSLFSLAQSEFSAEEMFLLKNSSIFTNGQFLLNAKSAALLGLSLALYQNIDAALSLDNVVPETFLQLPTGAPLPKTADKLNEQLTARQIAQNTFDNAKAGEAAKRTGELLAGGALINGALETIERYRKSGNPAVDLWADTDSTRAGFGFAAGATGAMMGATVGCVVPLAEKKVGEILGFAASVVVGLTDNGLQSLGANTLVSLVSSGVQSFLNASVGNQNALPDKSIDKLLNAGNSANVFEDDFQRPILGKITVFSAS